MMSRHGTALLIAGLSLALFPACAGGGAEASGAPDAGAAAQSGKALPPGHPPVRRDEPFKIDPPPPGAGEGQRALSWTAPSGWVAERPKNAMRRAQYRISGPGGDAECVVFYFGPGQGGDPMANALRWAGQFHQPDGKSARDALKTETRKVGGIEVLVVEVEGTYGGGMMMGGGGAPKPDYMLLGAIAQGPDANWFFKLTGPAATVKAQRKNFDALIASLRPGKEQKSEPA